MAERRLDRPLVVSEQEISSLVGEVRAESSEADAVAEEEPMHTDGQSEHVGSAAALQVAVESGRAATQVGDSRVNFPAHVEAHVADRPGLSFRWSPPTAGFRRSSCHRREMLAKWSPGRPR